MTNTIHIKVKWNLGQCTTNLWVLHSITFNDVITIFRERSGIIYDPAQFTIRLVVSDNPRPRQITNFDAQLDNDNIVDGATFLFMTKKITNC